MTAGLPGAGIGGLFYLASTIALPVRSVWRRVRGRPDPVSLRQLAQSLTMALGIIAGLWVAGWLLAFVVPQDMLVRTPAAGPVGGGLTARTVIPAATIAAGVATLALVLVSVEVARLVLRRKGSSRRAVARAGERERERAP